LRSDQVLNLFVGTFGQKRFAGTCLRTEARAEVHVRADHRIVQSIFTADAPENYLSGDDTDADLYWRGTGIPGVEILEGAVSLDGAPDGVRFHVFALKKRDNTIADILVDIAVKFLHFPGLKAQACIEQLYRFLRRQALVIAVNPRISEKSIVNTTFSPADVLFAAAD